MNPAAFFADYDAFGDRRTGGEGDAAAAIWLRDRAAATGARARLLAVPFTRFTPDQARLKVGGEAFDGLPLFDGGLADGIEGALGLLGSCGRTSRSCCRTALCLR